MVVYVIDHINGRNFKVEVEFTNHHQHSNTGRLIMIMPSGKELTPALWRLHECVGLVASAEEHRMLKIWRRIHSV